MSREPNFRVVKSQVPKICICPVCKVEQPFKKAGERWKRVKDINLENPTQLIIRVIRAKCLNPDCKTKSFALPISGVERYSRATERLKKEAIAGLVEDNSTCPRISKRLSRCFNTSGSQSAIYRWKQEEAARYDIKDIIAQLDFSGILSVDEYMPTRAQHYDLIAGDVIKGRILYVESIPEFYGRGYIESFLKRLQSFGIKPWAIIFDLLTAFPPQAKKVWPDVIIQFDYFHVQQWIHKFLKNALLQFRRSLKGKKWEFHREELWEHKWGLLKNIENWGAKEHLLIPEMMQIYSGTIVEKVLIFKEYLWNIFDNSRTKQEAISKRDELSRETWWRDSPHLIKAVNFLRDERFEFMVTYLEHRNIPRTSNSENLNSVWRQIESARFGFRTNQGRLDHLKLFQISKYLGGSLHRNRKS